MSISAFLCFIYTYREQGDGRKGGKVDGRMKLSD